MRINKCILDRQDFFQELVKHKKEIYESEIVLTQQQNNIRWLVGSSQAKLKSKPDKIDFIVKINKTANKYGIMLQCLNLCNEPYFRFDSDGPTHQNVSETIALEDRQVPTPHFNTYDLEGREFAYQNDILKNQLEAQAISNNLEFGISLFCNEANAFVNEDLLPICIDSTILPDFEIEAEFNLNNVKFE